MSRQALDLEKLRVALHRMSRDQLLIVAERAADLVPRAKLSTLVGDLVPLKTLGKTKTGTASLLDEVNEFRAASLRGEYYDSFDVNSKNYMEKSRGTETFIAEFARVLTRCVRAAAKGPLTQVREAFDLLFGLVRRVDDSPDEVIFFADEGGSYELGIDWRSVLSAYFRCLAKTASAEEFSREVDSVISDFAKYDRPRHLAAARRVASAEQKAALRTLSTAKRRQ